MKRDHFHKLTALFSRTQFDRIALVKNNWSHYSLLQQIQSGKMKNKNLQTKTTVLKDIYHGYPSGETQDLKKILEQNHPIHFDSLSQYGVKAHYYTPGDFLDTKSQAEPDAVIDMRDSSFIDRRIHGVDFKAYAKMPNEIDSRAFSQVSPEDYQKSLLDFENLMLYNLVDLNPDHALEINKALNTLAATATRNDLTLHHYQWAKYLHLFPQGYIPPVLLSDNFSALKLKTVYAKELAVSHSIMTAVSNYLYEKNVPENDIPRALEFFADSYMQKLLAENYDL